MARGGRGCLLAAVVAATVVSTAGRCSVNPDCSANPTWCHSQGTPGLCDSDDNCPQTQCVQDGASTSAPAPGAPGPTPAPEPEPTTSMPLAACVNQATLTCINEYSTMWPKCTPEQTKEGGDGLPQYVLGSYCTQEWVDALNDMLMDSQVNLCDNTTAIQYLLAQVAYETKFFTTVYSPAGDPAYPNVAGDGGAGLIHMSPAYWDNNALDMESLWTDHAYSSDEKLQLQGVFSDPVYGWRSVAAWYMRTNNALPGCSGNLFLQSYENQTRCITGHTADREELLVVAGRCLR